MAQRSSADVGFLLFGGVDILGVSTVLTEEPHEAILEETHGLGDAWAEHSSAGVKRYALKQEGFYDDASFGHNYAHVNLGTSILLYGLSGNVIGRVAEAGDVQVAKYSRGISRGELHKASVEYQGDGPPNRGLVSIPWAAVTAASGNSASSIDNGAATTEGATFDIGVSNLNLDGGSSLTVKLQDSADNIAWADVAGVTLNFAAAPNAGRIQSAAGATIRRYTRTAYVFNGGSGGSRTATIVTVLMRSIV